jgi:hypothetical protein
MAKYSTYAGLSRKINGLFMICSCIYVTICNKWRRREQLTAVSVILFEAISRKIKINNF